MHTVQVHVLYCEFVLFVDVLCRCNIPIFHRLSSVRTIYENGGFHCDVTPAGAPHIIGYLSKNCAVADSPV